MSYLFLLPLLTAAIAAYFWQRSSDEIAYLTSAATVLSLVLSLILAPWQIQLLILLTVVIIVTLLWQGREQAESASVATTETSVEKKYRGATYIEPTTVEVQVKEREGKYRGADVKITNNPSVATPIRPSSLKYRGAGSVNSDQ
jgi:membrane protein implicated in regulation of membrane protease activity